MKSITKAEKKNMVENKMLQIDREIYNQNLNLKMYAAYNERADIVKASKDNIEKQSKAYKALEKELAIVESIVE